MRSLVLGVAVLASACGAAQHFDAAERATATSPRGDVAAEYEVRGPSGAIAEVKVWTGGASEDEIDGREVTLIEVVFEIENEGAAPVELANILLDSARASGTAFDDLPPVRVDGVRLVRADDEETLRAYFALPERYDPEDVERFEIGWELRHAGGTYAQRTPFQQVPDYYAAYQPYPMPFYDAPFLGYPYMVP